MTRAGALTNLPPAARWSPRKWDRPNFIGKQRISASSRAVILEELV